MPKKLSDLKPSEKNPRRISDQKLAALGNTMGKYGDLSGITWNRYLEHLVTGHQRSKKLPPDSEIVIEQAYKERQRDGTVALGHILDARTGQRWAYREVEWDENDDLAANLAANASGGEFDQAKLADVVTTLQEADYELAYTGLSDEEIADVVEPVAPPATHTSQDKLSFRIMCKSLDELNAIQKDFGVINTQGTYARFVELTRVG